MATALLVSAAGANTTLSFLGALVGAYIDSAISQALVGGETTEGPRTDEFRVTRSEYGVPIPICYGPQNRVPGNIVWAAGVTETRHVKKVGGSIFGGSSKVISYTYSDSYAIAISARQISRVKKIWANNKIIFESEESDGTVPNVTLSPTFKAAVYALDVFFTIFADTGPAIDAFFSDLESDPPPTFSSTAEGGTIYVKNWVPSEITDGIKARSPLWEFIISEWEQGRKVDSTLFPADWETYARLPDADLYSTGRIPLRPEQRIRTLFYRYYPSASLSTSHLSVAEDITVYPGSLSQTPDPTVEATEGVGNAPSYAGIAYVVVQDFDLTTEFGNSVPNFEFEVEADTSITVTTLLDDLCDRAGITARSTLGFNDTVRGIALLKNSPLATYLPTIETSLRFRSVQQNGDIRFVKRPGGMAGTLLLEDLGGRQPDDDKEDTGPISYSLVSNVESPKEVIINYFDVNREITVNSQFARRVVNGGENNFRVELPFSFTADEASTVAAKIARDMWSRKWSVAFRTSDKYSMLKAGQTIGIPFNDDVKPIVLTSVNRGRNGVIEITGVYEDVNVGAISLSGESADYEGVSLTAQAKSVLQMIDGPLVATGDDNGGVYWAVGSDESGWIGADLLYTDDTNSGEFFEIADTNALASIGYVATALPTGPTVTWDRTNTISVELSSPDDSLSSATETEVLAGANLIWLGAADGSRGELLQFVDATFVSGTTYTLSTLLRGRYGTEHETTEHVADEVLVLMDNASVGSVTFSMADWDRTYEYTAPSTYELLAQASTVPLVNTGIRSKPLSPVLVQGSRDASNNLTVTWVRRSRGTRVDFGDGDTPLNEVSEAYEIDITGPGGTVLRTINATSATLTYSGTDQFNDGITPGDPVDMSIYQISDTKGRGYPARATV